MTSTVTVTAAPVRIGPAPPAGIDSDIVCDVAGQAAREITGVDQHVAVRARLVGGAAVLTVWLPVRYPLPVWRVAAVCRDHVRHRIRERLGIPVRRLDIEIIAGAGWA